MKRQSADRHDVPLRHFVLILSQPVFTSFFFSLMLRALQRSDKYQFHIIWYDTIGPRCHKTFSFPSKLFLLKSVFSANQIWVFLYLRIFSDLSKFSSFMAPGPGLYLSTSLEARRVWRFKRGKSKKNRQHNGQKKKDKQRSTKHCT